MTNVSTRRLFNKLVSDRDREICDNVFYVGLVTIISLCGVAANVINMIVFCRQGFINTMNISFFGIAISDMCGLLSMVCTSVFLNPLLVKSDVPIVPVEVQLLIAAVPRAVCSRITGWITVFITAERCLCITFPLRIKQMITPRKTIMIVCAIYLLVIVAVLPEYAISYLDWKFYPQINRSLIGLAFTEARPDIEGLLYILYSLVGGISFIAVTVFTSVLVVQLKKKSNWRTTANLNTASSETISTRDKKTMNMVVMIATILIVSYMPGAAVSMVTFFEPEFTIVGAYYNVVMVAWSVVFIFESLNSSVNIFLYYKMSSKYRETLHELFKVSAREIKEGGH